MKKRAIHHILVIRLSAMGDVAISGLVPGGGEVRLNVQRSDLAAQFVKRSHHHSAYSEEMTMAGTTRVPAIREVVRRPAQCSRYA